MAVSLDEVVAVFADGDLGFRQAVYATVGCIPRGRVLGYGHVAAILGNARRARQVGFALAALEPGMNVPWWRVIRSDGSIALQGDPVRGPVQEARLRDEDIEVIDHRVDMRRYRWDPWGAD